MPVSNNMKARVGGPRFGAGRPLKFNDELKERFLEEAKLRGTIGHAARAVGISYSCAAVHLRDDPEFRAAYDDAVREYTDVVLVDAAHKRAVDGWDERPVVNEEGVVVGYVHKYSDSLLLALLKRRDPEFRESSSHTTNVNVNAKVQVAARLDASLERLPSGQLAALQGILHQLAAPAVDALSLPAAVSSARVGEGADDGDSNT